MGAHPNLGLRIEICLLLKEDLLSLARLTVQRSRRANTASTAAVANPR